MKKIALTMAFAGLFAMSGFAGEIHNREVRQQQRIAEGVETGKLTPRETARLENREAHVNREVRRDRRANDGHLTTAERAQVNRQQNRISNAIYRDKHN